MRLLKFIAQADDLNGWQRARGNTRCNRKQLVLPFPCMMIRFERRCRRAEQREGIIRFRADNRDVAPVIPRRLFLLVTGLLFFIDDNEPNVF